MELYGKSKISESNLAKPKSQFKHVITLQEALLKDLLIPLCTKMENVHKTMYVEGDLCKI